MQWKMVKLPRFQPGVVCCVLCWVKNLSYQPFTSSWKHSMPFIWVATLTEWMNIEAVHISFKLELLMNVSE